MKRTRTVLLGCLLLAMTAAAQAQSGSGDGYDYIINAGNANTITITNYSGPGGAVIIPTNINSLLVTGVGNGSFSPFSGTNLTSVTIPIAVTSIGNYAFQYCTNLTGAYFEGNAPSGDSTVFDSDPTATVYYLPGTSGWSSTFGGVTAVMLNPPIPNGSLQVIIVPSGATNDGAQWQVVGGIPQPSRAVVLGLAVGNQTISYSTLSGWTAPSNQVVAIASGATTTVGGVYAPLYSGLVANGGFETGDFTGWVLSGLNTNNMIVDDGSQSGLAPLFGNYLTALGSVGSVSYLSQTLATTPGATYSLSLWLDSPDGLTNNEFLVSWNGNTLFDETNIPAIGWTNLQFRVTAATSSTVLEFGAEDDLNYLGLDGVSVFPVPGIAGLRLSGTDLVLNGVNGQSGESYYVLMGTNLARPLSQWTPVATNILSASGNFTITASNTVTHTAPQRFFVLQAQ